MKRTILILFFTTLFGCSFAVAQNTGLTALLNSIERNNLTLKALRSDGDAERLENRAETALPDTEVELGLLRNTHVPAGQRSDIRVRQGFDIPTLTGMKLKEARGKDRLVERRYAMERMRVLLEAHRLCIDLIYYDALLEALATRLSHAEAIAEAQQKRLDKGEGARPEYNNVRLNIATLQGTITEQKALRTEVIAALTLLNGGIEPDLTGLRSLSPVPLPAEGSEAYQALADLHPALEYARSQTDLSRTRLCLAKAKALPSFSIAYMSEKAPDERSHGVALGISIPLWSASTKIRQAKAAVVASESSAEDVRKQQAEGFAALYRRARSLERQVQTYRNALEEHDNSRLLKIALDEGHISIIEYLIEIGIYYDTIERALQAERDYLRTVAELTAPLL